jgi:N-acetylglucosaminyldiphosphoundecaprenol N-acetyl-beta-D-mannosaminyltransferase
MVTNREPKPDAEPMRRGSAETGDAPPSLGISVGDAAYALALCEKAISRRTAPPLTVAFCEANLLYEFLHSETVRAALRDTGALFADGVAVSRLAALNGVRGVRRLPGPSFLLYACRHGVQKGWRHYFYGGGPGVAEELSARMQSALPGIDIVGAHSPPMRPLASLAEDDGVLKRIEDAGTDLLWVGLGGPKQELWMAEHRDRIRVPVMLGVGAAFDFHTKRRPWAPFPIRELGMEWLYRTFTGGRKTTARNLRCVSAVARLLFSECIRLRLLRTGPGRVRVVAKSPDTRD